MYNKSVIIGNDYIVSYQCFYDCVLRQKYIPSKTLSFMEHIWNMVKILSLFKLKHFKVAKTTKGIHQLVYNDYKWSTTFKSCESLLCGCTCVCCHFRRVWLCNSMDFCPPSSSGHGVLQARILDWILPPSSRGSSQPRDQCLFCLLRWQVGSWPLAPPQKPHVIHLTLI